MKIFTKDTNNFYKDCITKPPTNTRSNLPRNLSKWELQIAKKLEVTKVLGQDMAKTLKTELLQLNKKSNYLKLKKPNKIELNKRKSKKRILSLFLNFTGRIIKITRESAMLNLLYSIVEEVKLVIFQKKRYFPGTAATRKVSRSFVSSQKLVISSWLALLKVIFI